MQSHWKVIFFSYLHNGQRGVIYNIRHIKGLHWLDRYTGKYHRTLSSNTTLAIKSQTTQMGGVNTDGDFSLDFDQPVVLVEYSEKFFFNSLFWDVLVTERGMEFVGCVDMATLLLSTSTSSWQCRKGMVFRRKRQAPFLVSSFWEGVNINPSVFGTSAALLVPASVFPPECHNKPLC